MGNFFPLFSNYTVRKVVFVISTLEKFIKKRGKLLIHYFYRTMEMGMTRQANSSKIFVG